LRALPLLSIAAVLASPLARAAEPGEPVQIEIQDKAGCTDKDAFMAAVRARSARIREAEPGETARAFRVALAVTPDGAYRGELTVVDADSEGPWGRSRSIDGKSCQEVVDALAIFTVLAVDPSAVTGEQPVDAPPEETAVPPPIPLAPPPPRAKPPKPPPPREQTHDDPARPRALAGIHAGLFAAGAAAPLPAGGAFSEIGYDDGRRVGVTWNPSARITLTVTGLAKVTVPEGTAALRWTKLGLDGCPFVFRVATSVAVRPCLTLSEGLLNASGRIEVPNSVTASFRTIGALARNEWEFAKNWLFELTLGVEYPLRRDSFYFEPQTPVYQVPPLVWVVSIAGGYRFL
jgi:hypothetical protein